MTTTTTQTPQGPSFGPEAGVSTAEGDRPELADLRLALRLIAEICQGGRPPDAVGDEPERWEDEHYLYLGARLAKIVSDIDISVHEDCILVRMAK